MADPEERAGPLRYDVLREGDTAQVRPVGEFDMAAVGVLKAEVAQLRASGCRHVIFDLRGLAFMDTSGPHFLLECDAESRKDGFDVALIAGSPAVDLLFEVSPTGAMLTFVDPSRDRGST